MKVAVIVVMILIGLGYYFISGNKPSTEPEATDKNNTNLIEQSSQEPFNQKTDTRASFAIFTNGTFRIFTDSMYHNLSEDAYIDSKNPNIIQVKISETTWGDFFKTLPFELNRNCLTTGTGQKFCDGQNGKLRFFINGKEDPEALGKVINHEDKLLVTFGSESESQIKNQLEKIPNP